MSTAAIIAPAPNERRVLALPATRADGLAMGKLFRANDIPFMVCTNMAQLCAEQSEGAGLLIVCEEAVVADCDQLIVCVNDQPVWSDLPIMVLSPAGRESVALAGLMGRLGNVGVVERPVRTSTLLSLVSSGLRARERQYQVRKHLSEQQQAQQTIHESVEAERAARSEAERAGRIKDEFLATLGHELRTPLNAVLGWTQVLRRSQGLSSDALKGLTVIERNARAQAQIIEDLLDMSSIISGKVRLDVQQLDLASVINATIETIRPSSQAKGIQLQVSLDPSVGPMTGDPNRLQQVLWNLLTNAVKFTPNGGRIAVILVRANTHVEIEVTDNGEGIEPAFLPHVFDRFRQADPSSTRRYGGLGLGLSIVKQLVELHGGSITAQSEGSGTGATFRIMLPVMAEFEHLEQPDVSAPRASRPDETIVREDDVSYADLGGIRVLVVDDDLDARGLIERLLHDCNARVTTAASVQEAIQALLHEAHDVLVSDIGMPGEDGYELIRRVRALSGRHSRIPAIALTAYARAEDQRKALQAGFQTHLTKPVEPIELVATVQNMTGGGPSH